MREKRDLFLKTREELNRGAMVSGVGFLLYLGVSALAWEAAALIVAFAFGLAALYVFLSAVRLRGREKEAASYSLMWGTGALTLLLLGCAVLTVRAELGL